MTTKEIAEAVGKAEKTVQTWARVTGVRTAAVAAKTAAAGHGKSADYDLDETIAIIEQGMGKNAASLYRASASRAAPPPKQSLDDAFKASIIALTNLVGGMNSRLLAIETRIEGRAALLPAPSIAPRDRVSMIVRSYCKRSGLDYSSAFGQLYREYKYRTHSDAVQNASNRGVKILDFIEGSGGMATLEAIAAEIYGET
jgi:hypothetical protein